MNSGMRSGVPISRSISSAGLVRAAMRRAPEAGDAGGDAGKGVGARGRGEPHRRGRGVLLVIGVQREDPVHRAGQDRVDHVFLGRDGEAHVQEVRRVVEVVARIHEGLADRVLVGHAAIVGILAISRIEATSRCQGSCDVGADRGRSRHRADHADHRSPSDARRAGSRGRNTCICSCSMVWRVTVRLEILELGRPSAVRRRAAGSRPRGSATSRPAGRSGSRGAAARPRRRRCR